MLTAYVATLKEALGLHETRFHRAIDLFKHLPSVGITIFPVCRMPLVTGLRIHVVPRNWEQAHYLDNDF